MTTIVQPGVPTESGAWVIRHLVAPVVRRCFRPELEGAEKLPDEPYLLVSNHSAGMAMAELASIGVLWLEHFGREGRPLAGFAHPISFKLWPLTSVMRMTGAVPSTYEAAYETLEAGSALLVFPGGDHDTLRPVWRASEVDFDGRKGFLKIAREARVPIVCMGIRGSHFTAPILFRARFLSYFFVVPKLAGINRWGISALGVIGCVAIAFLPLEIWARVLVAWLWLGSPFVYLPWIPAKIRFKIGRIFEPEDLAETPLGEALDRVESEIGGLIASI